MDNILEVVTTDTVVSTEIIVDILESNSSEIIVGALPELLQEKVEVITIIEVGVQGPPGPTGPQGNGGNGSNTGSFEAVLDVDYSGIVYSYVGFATRIARVDYSVSPPVVLNHTVTDYATEWPNRQILGYT